MVKTSTSHPIPPANRLWRFKYPWPTMKVGESFFAKLGEGQSIEAHRLSMKAQCSNNKRKLKKTFVCKVENEFGTPGVRVWRTK